MKTSNHHLTLGALDRLAPAETCELESQLAAEPRLAEELRATEDAITAIWLAASPLVPAPAESLKEIRAKLDGTRQQNFNPRLIALAGWAAALVLLAVMIVRRQPENPAGAEMQTPEIEFKQQSALRPGSFAAPPTQSKRARNEEPQRKLQETVLMLQQELRVARSGSISPRIRALRSPTASASAAASDPVRELLDLLTAALTEDLARRTEIPTSLIVETGWTPAAFAALPAGSVVRHRSFPVENYEAYGLLRAANGDFYDPFTHFLWTPAEDGGGYLGERPPASQDLTEFKAPQLDPKKLREFSSEKSAKVPAADTLSPQKPDPIGYVIQSAVDDKVTVIIGNLPISDPVTTDRFPTSNQAPQLIASVDGGLTRFPLTDGVILPGPDGTGFASFSLPTSISGNSWHGTGLRNLTIHNSVGPPTVILTTSPQPGGE